MSLDPVIAAIVEKSNESPALSDGTPAESRSRLALGRAGIGSGPDMHSVSDQRVSCRGGAIRTRIFTPSDDVDGIILFLHGGGWVLGAIEDFDTYARALAAYSNCTVVLPDYRLAPENRFPAGLQDAKDVLHWIADNRGALAAENAPLVIAGDSAGGNLATVVARHTIGDIDIALQVLYYPVADCNFETVSYKTHGTGLPLKSRDMEWFFSHYAPRDQWMNSDIAPLRSTDLSGMPPAIIVVAEYDVLHDEGVAYGEKLRNAGCVVTQRTGHGLTHGFIRLHNLCEPTLTELRTVAQEIRQACAENLADRTI